MDVANGEHATLWNATGLLLTRTEFDQRRDELARLLEIRNRDFPDLLRHARTFVASDAAEEIIQLQEDQAVVEARIRGLQNTLRGARVVTGSLAVDVVTVGSVVELEYVSSGDVVIYRVMGAGGSPGARAMSAGSPVGRALMGHVAGDTVTVDLPSGRCERLRVISIAIEDETTWA